MHWLTGHPEGHRFPGHQILSIDLIRAKVNAVKESKCHCIVLPRFQSRGFDLLEIRTLIQSRFFNAGKK